MNALKDLLGTQFLFFDGGTGSVLQGMGLRPGELPERWNVAHPERITALHVDYLRAGADIIKTNTFGAFSTKFPSVRAKAGARSALRAGAAASGGIPPAGDAPCLADVVRAAVENAAAARRQYAAELSASGGGARPCFIALDIGPCGKLLKPMGDLDFEDAVSLFKETIRCGLSDEVDAILIETMNDSYETKAAVVAAKEVREELGRPDVPIFATNVYDAACHLLTGADPEAMAALLEGLGVDALGLNCSLGPEQMKPAVERLAAAADIPIVVNPNAGLPRSEGGRTVYDVSAEEFAASMRAIAEMGASVLGGCCGTTPEYVRAVRAALADVPFPASCAARRAEPPKTLVSSYTHVVQIGGGAAPVLIGERINPTGKKKFKQALRDNDISYIVRQGLEQETAGAHVLDVNVGLPEIDEKAVMVRVMTELQGVTALPLQLDTSSPDVMEAALRRYNGKALVNSVNGKQAVMDAVFPLVKKYGGVVVALTLDEGGIPETAAGRIRIVEKLYENAARWGIPRKDVVIDALTMAVSSDTDAALATLETLRIVRDEFGGNTVLGVSNISFGLPEREFVTAQFFTMAMQNGLGAAIMNPLSGEMQKAYRCFCLLNGQDKDCLNYIEFAQRYGEQKKAEAAALAAGAAGGVPAGAAALSEPAAPPDSPEHARGTLQYSVIHGLKDDAAAQTRLLLEDHEAVDVIDRQLIPGLDFVGRRFEQKTMYLPQLLMAADAAKSAFAVIKETLERTGRKGASKGTVIVATVHGDIHDIGKNIVKVLLENYDFTVIDLGKDVPPEAVVRCCVENHVELVGLSALMTTTVPAMKETIEQLRTAAPWAKVCVGGAVMTQEYADSIGADFYGKDAMATVTYAQQVFKR
ncbi:MAG: homocysteine S-methyltransferase family protein [Treponemataceae bacterium]|nr:homocysteine S-methyltransferase family protein [Treponemataceae bacterium]